MPRARRHAEGNRERKRYWFWEAVKRWRSKVLSDLITIPAAALTCCDVMPPEEFAPLAIQVTEHSRHYQRLAQARDRAARGEMVGQIPEPLKTALSVWRLRWALPGWIERFACWELLIRYCEGGASLDLESHGFSSDNLPLPASAGCRLVLDIDGRLPFEPRESGTRPASDPCVVRLQGWHPALLPESLMFGLPLSIQVEERSLLGMSWSEFERHVMSVFKKALAAYRERVTAGLERDMWLPIHFTDYEIVVRHHVPETPGGEVEALKFIADSLGLDESTISERMSTLERALGLTPARGAKRGRKPRSEGARKLRLAAERYLGGTSVGRPKRKQQS